jgi:serine/threonine protein kinase
MAQNIVNALLVNTILSGRYQIERVIGQGGFGITYYARHLELGTFMAIKEFFLSGMCLREPDGKVSFLDISPEKFDKFRTRFRDEARTLCQLNNPHVVSVRDVFDENGTTYIVMDYVSGETLQAKVEREGALPYDEAVNYIAQLCEAVAHIHSHHILHRDIKPDNIIITPQNKVVLIDFGSARSFVHDQEQRHTAMITVGYAPIEQYSANSKKGNYTDIYALGGTFYFILTGQKPVSATDRMMKIDLPEPQTFNPQISDEANRTIMKALSLQPEDRYQTISAFVSDLLGSSTECTELQKDSGDSGNKQVAIMIAIVIGIAFVVGLAFLVDKENRSDYDGPGTSLELGAASFEDEVAVSPPEDLVEENLFIHMTGSIGDSRGRMVYDAASDTGYYVYSTFRRTLQMEECEGGRLILKAYDRTWKYIGRFDGTITKSSYQGVFVNYKDVSVPFHLTADEEFVDNAETPTEQPIVAEWVDLELPSGTLWMSVNETGGRYGDGLYTYDEAIKYFGNSLPSKEQYEELRDYCTWTWMGNGYQVTGQNGLSIRLHLTGFRDTNGKAIRTNQTANLWSRTVDPEAPMVAYKLYFRSGHKEVCTWQRNNYHAVRLVRN